MSRSPLARSTSISSLQNIFQFIRPSSPGASGSQKQSPSGKSPLVKSASEDHGRVDPEKAFEMYRTFSKHDTNGEGSLDSARLSVFMKEIGYPENEVNALLEKWKLTPDKKLTFAEFIGNLQIEDVQKSHQKVAEMLGQAGKSSKISDQTMQKARSLFTKYDQDADGTINHEELRKIFDEFGTTPSAGCLFLCISYSAELMRKLDPDGNGNITFMEFINAYPIWAEILEDRFTVNDNYKGNKIKLSDEQIAVARTIFSKYDKDNDGQVTSEELFLALQKLLEPLCEEPSIANHKAKELMSIIDADGDGNITFIEFLKGYHFWSQVEQASAAREQIAAEMEKLQKSFQTSFSRRSLVDKELQRLRDDLSQCKEQYSSATKERLRLEKELNKLIDEDQQMTYSDDSTETQRSLRTAYNELSDLQMLRLKSREFYCRMQVYIANHPTEDQTPGGQPEASNTTPTPVQPAESEALKGRKGLKSSTESKLVPPKKTHPKLQLNLNALKKTEASPSITVTPPVQKG